MDGDTEGTLLPQQCAGPLVRACVVAPILGAAASVLSMIAIAHSNNSSTGEDAAVMIVRALS